MLEKISDGVMKFKSETWGSNCYIISIYDNKKKEKTFLIIDTSDISNREHLIYSIEEAGIKKQDIKAVLITHWHPDHIQNISLFENAELFVSEEEIRYFDLEKNYSKKINAIEDVEDRWEGLEVIHTPGHTVGSVCFLLEDKKNPSKKILFSGDTLFSNGVGRTDFPSGEEEQLMRSLNELEKINYHILCPGHDY